MHIAKSITQCPQLFLSVSLFTHSLLCYKDIFFILQGHYYVIRYLSLKTFKEN